MIRARHTFTGEAVARLFSGPLLGSAFREIRIVDDVADEGLPILMLANHFSWWDGFIQHRINRARFGRRLYAMMLEEQLAKHPILARCGCFSVRRQSRSMLESLDYCIDVMRSPGNMLLIFPQGRLESMHVDVPAFRAGVRYLAERIEGPYGILLDVNLPDYGAHKLPSLDCYLKMLPAGTLSGDSVRREWERFYVECKRRQAER